MGYEKVKVIRRPKVALISTGDEVICGGKPLTEGKIYDSNRRMIASRLEELGCEVVVAEVMGDDENLIANEIKEIIKNVDVDFHYGWSFSWKKRYYASSNKNIRCKKSILESKHETRNTSYICTLWK